jgi:hypothetical protein
MTNEELKRALAGMDDTQLAEADLAIKAARDGRRPGFDLNNIKVGMKPEDAERARLEIARVLAGR